MELKRRPLLMQPGESLLVRANPIEAAIRWGAFLEASGLSADHLGVNPLVSFPLPLVPAEWPQGSKRWPGTRPEIMWHPLMWLPRRLSHRYTITEVPTAENDPMGLHAETYPVEDDHTWAVRVALELTAAGMHDPETGTWADVLSTVGLDIDDEFDFARVEEWLAGADDELLDGLDLSAHFDNPNDPDWALAYAREATEDLFVVTWATAADNMLDAFYDLQNRYEDVTRGADNAQPFGLGELRWMAAMLTDYAWSSLRRVPDRGGIEAADAWWAAAKEQINDSEASDADVMLMPVQSVVDRLERIGELYWPEMERIGRSAAPPELASTS